MTIDQMCWNVAIKIRSTIGVRVELGKGKKRHEIGDGAGQVHPRGDRGEYAS